MSFIKHPLPLFYKISSPLFLFYIRWRHSIYVLTDYKERRVSVWPVLIRNYLALGWIDFNAILRKVCFIHRRRFWYLTDLEKEGLSLTRMYKYKFVNDYYLEHSDKTLGSPLAAEFFEALRVEWRNSSPSLPWCQSKEKILRNNDSSFPRVGIEPTTVAFFNHTLVLLAHDGRNVS